MTYLGYPHPLDGSHILAALIGAVIGGVLVWAWMYVNVAEHMRVADSYREENLKLRLAPRLQRAKGRKRKEPLGSGRSGAGGM